jgi:hypothetical protein
MVAGRLICLTLAAIPRQKHQDYQEGYQQDFQSVALAVR